MLSFRLSVARLTTIFFVLPAFIPVTLLLSESSHHQRITIQGKITIKGSEPHTFVALTTEMGAEYQLRGSPVEELRQQYQGVILKLSGTIISKKSYAIPIKFKVEAIK